MKRIAIFLLALGWTIEFLTAAAFSQEGSVIELVEECDILAAHPADPERMADGVADDEIVPRLAILACESAIESDPEDPRFVFQLGRALLSLGRKEKAFELFQKAAAADYAAAWAYLGDCYQFGLGTKVNGKLAFDAYKKAREKGFDEAKLQIEQLKFDPSMYTSTIVNLFYEGKHIEIARMSNDPKGQWLTRNYTFNLIQSLQQECEPYLEPQKVPALYAYRYPKNWTPNADENVIIAIQTSVAEHDAAAFISRHGCDGLIAKHIFKSINLFLGSKI